MNQSAEERNAHLIGQTCGDITITGFVPRKTLTRPPRITVHCRCGVDYTLDLYGVKDKLRTGRGVKCPHVRPEVLKTEDRFAGPVIRTLCEHCKKATNRYLCPWAGGKPRKDWTATETYIHDSMGHGYQSYRVLKCPGFERG